jgi:arabinan endo-1,5-alpha-L-arabinosidase
MLVALWPGLMPRAVAQLPVLGFYFAHDPSTMIKDSGRYYVFRTDQGISINYTTDLRNWNNGGRIFPGNPPSWTTNAVPGFTGFFWAPDIVLLNGTYYLYYSVSGFGQQVSSIGLVTTTNITQGNWTDQGEVIHSTTGDLYNCIDPSILVDTNGSMWMTFGSFWNGIYLMQLDPSTGKRISPASTLTHLANNSSIEASCLYQRGGYYYLFVNWGTCCSGVDSTYNIRVGRSTSITGPYLDRNGFNLTSGGGSLFLESTGRFIGPGHAGIMNDNATNWFTYHYYDGNDSGTAKLGLGRLQWGADNWPVLTNDWSAFYTFEVDAREHRAQYNGTLKNGATVAPEPNRGAALNLNGVNQFVTLPISVANASTFATWVKWAGGADWQRIFDFGTNTSKYLFLTPRANTGKMRFAIRNGGAEQTIDAPTALPTNSWAHVAVTVDGSRGILYLDGQPVGTNNSVNIRPWQILCRSNFLGDSQFTNDPAFNGKLDSFRIFGRPLSAAEIRDIAYAHPSLAHRYSFTSDARDSIGMAHGTLIGNALVTNAALKLTGASGSYVDLPGGLVSGSAAVTIEFWAGFGANGNWARVFDFGNFNGTSGQNFLFFSPHTSAGGLRQGLSTAGGTVNFDTPGTFDNQTLHVVCISDPTAGYSAIYTNGVLLATSNSALPALSGVSTAWSFLGRSLFSSDAWLNATIDELRIYDGRLTPDEIAANEEAGPDASALPMSLNVSLSGLNLTLSWPAYGVGFVLETSPSLGADAVWSPLPQIPVLNNDAWAITLPATETAAFYRLRR